MTASIKACMNGSYPRGPGLARLYSRYLSGKIDESKFSEGIREYLRKLFNLFSTAGITVFTDGMLRWDDIFNPFIRFVDGVEVNGLVRFYDNNFFFRAPRVKGELGIKENPLPNWFSEALSIAEEVFSGRGFVLKQPLPGPLTLAESSINEYYSSYWSLLSDWRSKVLEPLIKDLSKVGVKVVEVHEPSLVWGGTKKTKVVAGAKELGKLIKFCKSLGVDVWVITYFGYLGRVGKYLSELSGAVVGIDCFVKDTKKTPQRLVRDYGIKRVMLGAIDSRNTLMEKPRELSKLVRSVARAGTEEVYVGNNAPMDFIPEVVAAKKLRRLGRVISGISKG